MITFASYFIGFLVGYAIGSLAGYLIYVLMTR